MCKPGQIPTKLLLCYICMSFSSKTSYKTFESHNDTEEFQALFELKPIRRRYSGSFVGIFPGLDLVYKCFGEQAPKHKWRTQLLEEEPSVVFMVKNVEDDSLSGHTMLDGREGDEYHPWFYLDQWSTPLVFSCLFDELPNDEAQAGVDTDQTAAVLRPSAVRLEEII